MSISLRYLGDVGRTFVRRVSNQIQYRRGPLPLWHSDPGFRAIYERIRHRTLVDEKRCHLLYQLAQSVRSVEGVAAELGVYRGGTAFLLAKVFGDRAVGQTTVHLFDTFEGMPSVDEARDLHLRGDLRQTSVAAVRGFCEGLGNLEFHQGLFPSTAEGLDARFAFVHVDADIYRSVADACAYFYPRLARGAVMVFDDYGFRTCPGAKLAVDEFFAGADDKPTYLATGQTFLVKR